VRVSGPHALLRLAAALTAAMALPPGAGLAQPAAAPPDETAAAPVPTLPPVDDALPRPALSEDGFPDLPGSDAVAWPTVDTTTDGDAAAVAGDVRYTVAIKGLEALRLESQFRQLSALWTRRGDAANLAQIDRRIAEDRDLIDQLLRSIGHYGGRIEAVVTQPTRADAPVAVAFTVDPGPLYTFSQVTASRPEGAVGSDPAPVVLPLLGVKPGDPVDAGKVTVAEGRLQVALAEAGYAFAVLGARDIVVDHASRTATLDARVDLGRRGRFGGVRIAGETQGYTQRHLDELPRFAAGDAYTDAGRDDLRRALIQTGLFGSVEVKPVAGAVNADGTQTIDLLATTERAPVRTIAASLGYQTVQGIRAEASWSNRNFLKPEGALTIRGVGAQREQALSFELDKRNFRHRDQTLSFRLGFSAEQQTAYSATTAVIGASLRRESNIIWQKPWTYSIGAEAVITRQRDRSAPNDPNNTYFIVALPGSVTWDRSDDLLNPVRGFRLTARISPEISLRSGSTLGYAKVQLEGSYYQPITPNLVAAARLHVGTIAGVGSGRIAPDRRFYAGGGGSVRGYSFQQVGPRDADNAPTGGNSLTEASIELRTRFRAFGSDLGLVGFVDAGQVSQSTLPGFERLSVGAGIGFRLFTGFGPVRVDVATPLNPRTGDPRVQFYVSIGQAF
jgi:translocation and assembly module TamA